MKTACKNRGSNEEGAPNRLSSIDVRERDLRVSSFSFDLERLDEGLLSFFFPVVQSELPRGKILPVSGEGKPSVLTAWEFEEGKTPYRKGHAQTIVLFLNSLLSSLFLSRSSSFSASLACGSRERERGLVQKTRGLSFHAPRRRIPLSSS